MKARTLLVLGILPSFLRAGADPFVGNWRLDPDKSKFTIGDPSFFFGTMLIEPAGAGLKSTGSATSGEGLANEFTFNCTLDETPCKMVTALPMRGSSAVDTITLKRIDDHAINAKGMWKGSVIYTDRRVVSADGNTMTIRRSGTTGGRKYESIIVLARVQ